MLLICCPGNKLGDGKEKVALPGTFFKVLVFLSCQNRPLCFLLKEKRRKIHRKGDTPLIVRESKSVEGNSAPQI